MREYQKTQCFETLALLTEAHAQLTKFIEKKQSASALALLEQCQQGAISVGTLIDSLEGDGTEAVRCLESYCEQVYGLYTDLQQGTPVNIWQVAKKLKKMITRCESAIRHQIPTRREVVFLPYKASMWDSLESVWKAAAEDPDCTALVIPIPYYDKNPDGSVREMHYEINEYPPDVPVISYDTYDFESRHPDMIFIHNPYDDGNYVTSVLPFFYAKNLKQYTDKLVYIPYFILGDIDPANEESVRRMEHFCLTEGVVNADCVIVQSESMRQVYVDVLTKYTSEKERPRWEKKILGLGSPKVDRVCSLRSEDFELPEEWERLIVREDGTRRKVIFYNTSVTAFLEHGEKMLLKMRDVFRVFAENKEEVALLWRPHPLIRATIESMQPKLWEEYQEIVREYQAAGWGIYDDTADVDRAMVLSDGYYGDQSSVVKLCMEVQKPVKIQNVEI